MTSNISSQVIVHSVPWCNLSLWTKLLQLNKYLLDRTTWVSGTLKTFADFVSRGWARGGGGRSKERREQLQEVRNSTETQSKRWRGDSKPPTPGSAKNTWRSRTNFLDVLPSPGLKLYISELMLKGSILSKSWSPQKWHGGLPRRCDIWTEPGSHHTKGAKKGIGSHMRRS